MALLVDDLQWCDRDTLDWLHFLVRFDDRARLLVVATIRSDELEPGHPLARLLDAMRREGRVAEIALGPLSRDETFELAQHAADRPLDADDGQHVYAETEGNPLFVVEMVRAGLVSRDREVGSPRPRLPPGMQAVLSWRLMQLSPAARELVRVAAVVGRSFTAAVLQRCVELGEELFARGLDELWQRRIVRELGDDAYDFSHDKLREAVYSALSPARRSLLHARVAAVLEALHAGALDPISGQLAAHYERAGMAEQAAAYAWRAAGAARRLYANDEALTAYRRSLALLPPGKDEQAAALHEELGDLLHHLARYDEARAAWQAALARAADGTAQAPLHRKIGNALRDEGRHDAALASFEHAERVLDLHEDGPPQAWQAWIDVQFDRALVSYWVGDTAALGAAVARMEAPLQAHGTLLQRARLHQVRAMHAWRRYRFTGSESLAHARAFVLALRAAGLEGMLPAAQFQHGFALLWGGALDEATAEIDAALALAMQRGDVLLEARCLTYLAVIARKQGDAARVRELAYRGLPVFEAGHMHDYVGAAHGNLAWLAWRNGAVEMVADHGMRAMEAWRRLSAEYIITWLARWPLIGVALEAGDVSAAAGHARALLDERQQRPPPEIEPALLAAVAAADAGDLHTARAHLQQALGPARELSFL